MWSFLQALVENPQQLTLNIVLFVMLILAWRAYIRAHDRELRAKDEEIVRLLGMIEEYRDRSLRDTDLDRKPGPES